MPSMRTLKTEGTIPTVRFASFMDMLDVLERQGHLAEPIASEIWESVFKGTAGKARLGFRFLGLVDADNMPTDALRVLVKSDGRRDAMRNLLAAKTPKLVDALRRPDATRSDLAAIVNDFYEVAGDTAQKASVFFVSAAEFAGYDVPPSLRVRPDPFAQRRGTVGRESPTQANGHRASTEHDGRFADGDRAVPHTQEADSMDISPVVSRAMPALSHSAPSLLRGFAREAREMGGSQDCPSEHRWTLRVIADHLDLMADLMGSGRREMGK